MDSEAMHVGVAARASLDQGDEIFVQDNDDESLEEEAMTDSIFEADFDDIIDFDEDEQLEKLSQKDKVGNFPSRLNCCFLVVDGIQT